MKRYNGRRKLAAALITSILLTGMAPSYASSGFIFNGGAIHGAWGVRSGHMASSSEVSDSRTEDTEKSGKKHKSGSFKPSKFRATASDVSQSEATASDASQSDPPGSDGSHSKATSSNTGSVLASPSVVKPPVLAEASGLPPAVAAAAVSFNRKVEFVDIEGNVLSDDECNIPETEDSFPYLSQGEGRTKGKINLEEYGYVEKEYFLKGRANVYDLKNGSLATKSDAGYTNRILVFRPENAADFNGAVYVDILNASSKVDVPDIWRRSYDFFMNSGYIYIGITSKDVNVQALKRFDPKRYRVLNWKADGRDENGLFWDMLGQLGALIKEEDSPLLYGGDYSGSVYSYVLGQSQSGWYVNTFSNWFGAANHLLDDSLTEDDIQNLEEEPHIYDGFLNVVGASCIIQI